MEKVGRGRLFVPMLEKTIGVDINYGAEVGDDYSNPFDILTASGFGSGPKLYM